MNRQVGLRRLEKLGNYLIYEIAPKAAARRRKGVEKFNMTYWGNARKLGLEEVNCSTSGCACGWATTIPEFKKAGLSLEGDLYSSRGMLFYQNPKTGDTYEAFDAAMEFFGLTSREAAWLFGPDSYMFRNRTRPGFVGRRILRFVADGGLNNGAKAALTSRGR